MRSKRAQRLAQDTVRRLRTGELIPIGSGFVGMTLEGSYHVTGNGTDATDLTKQQAIEAVAANLTARKTKV